MILQEFYEQYQKAQNKTTELNNEKITILQNFQAYLFEKKNHQPKGPYFSRYNIDANRKKFASISCSLISIFLRACKK